MKFIQLLLTNDLCRDEADGGHCFTQAEEDVRGRGGYEVDTRDLASLRVDCPPDLDGECPEDQPDPPEAPEPPEPECGDLEVAEPGAVRGNISQLKYQLFSQDPVPGEECDCGKSWSECEDPCCYPATLTPADLAANSSALPCTRHQQVTCNHACVSTCISVT